MSPANWRKPTDHQPKQPRTRSAKPGTLHQRAMLAYRNAGKTTTAEFLASIGADDDTIRRFASPFGRKVAQAYRAATGSEPTKNGAALVRGQLMRVFAYADRELLANVALATGNSVGATPAALSAPVVDLRA